jgi:hypothetical protein
MILNQQIELLWFCSLARDSPILGQILGVNLRSAIKSFVLADECAPWWPVLCAVTPAIADHKKRRLLFRRLQTAQRS